MTSAGDVQLRDVTEDDLPIFFEHQRDPAATQMAAFASRDKEAFPALWTGILCDETVTKKTVLVDGEVAGNIVGFEHAGRPEVGYWIGRGVLG